MQLAMIAAVSSNGVIGREGELPWRLRADLQRFKRLTMGHPIIMGRVTFDSIGCALPGRTSIVLTRSDAFQPPPGVLTADSWSEALQLCGAVERAFVIGGEQVYRLALPHVDVIHLTRVHAEVDGDARFPQLDEADWEEVEREETEVDQHNELPTTYQVLKRIIKTTPFPPANDVSP